ncbi:hypothetical protein N431DRAFT_477796 [Stipitochalara longipes BDJ]|nr:hypothetical protein N431DRAFT_477796 [Stipitochalara longipes BDJ]
MAAPPPPMPVVKDALARFGTIRRRLQCSDLLPLSAFMPGESDASPSRVESCELATSYSWLVLCERLRYNEGGKRRDTKKKGAAEKKRPAIGVPGVPPLFAHPRCPFVLETMAPNENNLVDHNPPGMQSFRPVFQALLYTRPDFDMRRIQLVADVEFLSKLWSIVATPPITESE